MSQHNGCWHLIYNAISEAMPDGISSAELKKKLNISINTIYGSVHHINKNKPELYKVQCIRGSYRLIDRIDKNTPIAYVNNTALNNTPKPSIEPNQIIPKNLLCQISELSISDKQDFNDLIKKALFYGKSAIALLEATRQANKITEGH